ncbi:MAG TPA: squalene--hopene cyclase [Streptosporangiaceae bacterium]|jgi:squalene-hopene/tetraprenyl-beta-curcumene cyclase
MTLTQHDQQQAGPPEAPADPVEAARLTLKRAREHLTGLQHDEGWWQGELETNVTMDAEDLMLREFLGIRTAEESAAAGRWIRSQQREDGTWANFYGGPGDLSTTIEAYVALRLAGDSPDEPHMATAAEWIRGRGGIEASRVFTRIWLAMLGRWSWDLLPVIPPELIYLPAWFPLNVYDWGCWARQTIVPLAIVGSLKPSRPLAFDVDELLTGVAPAGKDKDPWSLLFNSLDRALRVYEKGAFRGARRRERAAHPMGRWGKGPTAAVRRAALRRCAEWVIARQEQDGCWGGIQPPWVYSLIALNLLGYRLDHPVVRRGLAGLNRFIIHEETAAGTVRRLEACQSPVWDTVLGMVALGDSGSSPDEPALVRAGDWVMREENPGPGDWQIRTPWTDVGGWAFEFDNDGYPDIDDTAEVILALRKRWPAGTSERADAAISRAVDWVLGMQSKDGGWGAFDVDNDRQIVTKLPFCDFGAVIDPPTADVTAHVVEALAHEGMSGHLAVRRGVTWLLRAQEADGSWFGRWGANYVYGTGAVVPALIAAGVKPGKPCIRRAVTWLEEHQNADGGWGEDLRSYDDPALAGRGESTASQTAWALMALLAAEGDHAADSDAVRRGAAWLAATQRADGTWHEPQFTGTGFPGDFYINYHLYRLVFPVSALGRYLRATEKGAEETGGAA